MRVLVLLHGCLLAALICKAMARPHGLLSAAKHANVKGAYVVNGFQSVTGSQCTSGLGCELQCLRDCVTSSLDIQCGREVCTHECDADRCEYPKPKAECRLSCKGDCQPNCRRQVVQDLHSESHTWAHCTLGHKVKCEMHTCSHLRLADDKETCRARCVARAAAACALPERKAKKCLAACGAHMCVAGTCTCPVIAGTHRKCAVTLQDIDARLHHPAEAQCFQTFWPHMSKNDSERHQRLAPLALTPVLQPDNTDDESGDGPSEVPGHFIIANASEVALQHEPEQLQRLRVHELNHTAWLSSRDAMSMEPPLLAARRVHDTLLRFMDNMEAAWHVKRHEVGGSFDTLPGKSQKTSLTVRMVMKASDGSLNHQASGRRALSEVVPLDAFIDAQLPNRVLLRPTDVVPEADLRNLATWATCAVVGSSGALLVEVFGDATGGGRGPEIDRHTAVFRFNKAPTEGYEQDVGTKTTLRLQNNRHCGWCERPGELLLPATDYRMGRCYMYERRPECRVLVPDHSLKDFVSQRDPGSVFQRFSAQSPPSPPQGRLLNDTTNQNARRWLREGRRNNPDEKRRHRDDAEKDMATKTRKPLGKTLSAGFFGIQLAMHLCGEVTVYGFTEDQAQHYYTSYVPAMRPTSTKGLVKIFTGRDAHNWPLERHCLDVYNRQLPRFRIAD